MDGDHSEGGVNPSLMKKAKLRGVLLDHGVEYASNAKKAELVDLYRKHVLSSTRQTVVVEDVTFEEKAGQNETKKSRKTKKTHRNKYVFDSNDIESAEAVPSVAIGNLERVNKKKKAKKSAKAPEQSMFLVAETAQKTKPSMAEEATEKEEEPQVEGGSLDRKENSEIASHISVNQVHTDNLHELPALDHAVLSASKLRKRKSMLEEVDLDIAATPSKGNIFEVESESEPEVLSSRRKRSKRAEGQTFSSPHSPAPRKQFPGSSVTNIDAQFLSARSPTPNRITGFREDTDRIPSQKASPKVKPNYDSSVLQASARGSLSEHTSISLSELTDEPSVWFKSHLSFQEREKSHVKDDFDSLSSASQSFDSALSKLKKESRSDNVLTSQEKKEELAKLLNIDVHSIKPKIKGTRSITPKRPIIISLALLSRSRGSSPRIEKVLLDDVEDNLSTDEETEKPASPKQNAIVENVSNGHVAPASERSSHLLFGKSSSSLSLVRAMSYLTLWLSFMGVLFFGYWYREQTFLIGYCGQSIDRKTIPDIPHASKILVGLGEYLDDNFKPECVDCPQHARCFPRLEIACYDDFVVSAPWYYPYLPNFNLKAQKCVPDTKKAEKIEIMIEVALDLLRARNANKNCGKSEANDVSAGLEAHELHDLLLALKAPYITEEEFEELWKRSVAELEKESEIIVRYTSHLVAPRIDGNDTVAKTHYKSKVFRSTSLSHINFKCMMSNTVLSLALRFKKTLAIITLTCTLVYTCYWRYQQHRLHVRKVDTLYQEVLNKLRRQAKLGRDSRELPKFIGSVQLRDLILSSECNLAYKMRLWQAVSQKVDRNTNVKHELLEVHGEVMKVWQWITSVE